MSQCQMPCRTKVHRQSSGHPGMRKMEIPIDRRGPCVPEPVRKKNSRDPRTLKEEEHTQPQGDKNLQQQVPNSSERASVTKQRE